MSALSFGSAFKSLGHRKTMEPAACRQTWLRRGARSGSATALTVTNSFDWNATADILARRQWPGDSDGGGQLLQSFCSLLDGVFLYLNQRAKTAVAGAEGLDCVDIDVLRRQFRQGFSDCARMIFSSDVECRLLLAEFDLELLGGLLEECHILRNQVD